MRAAAVEALGDITEPGNAVAIAALIAHLEDENAFVRTAAVTALALVANIGNASVIAALTARSEDEDAVVRRRARRLRQSIDAQNGVSEERFLDETDDCF